MAHTDAIAGPRKITVMTIAHASVAKTKKAAKAPKLHFTVTMKTKDWYTPTGVTTSSGLLQVSFDEEMSTVNRWTFLKDMHRANIVLWPSYSHTPHFEVIPRTFVVVEHTAPLRDNDSEGMEEPEDDQEHEEDT